MQLLNSQEVNTETAIVKEDMIEVSKFIHGICYLEKEQDSLVKTKIPLYKRMKMK